MDDLKVVSIKRAYTQFVIPGICLNSTPESRWNCPPQEVVDIKCPNMLPRKFEQYALPRNPTVRKAIDEEFDKLMQEFIRAREEYGYQQLLEWQNQLVEKNKKKMGLVE